MLIHLLKCTDFNMPLLAFTVYLFQRKKIGDYNKGFLFFYLLICMVLYGASNIMGYHNIHNLWLYHFIHWAELVMSSYYLVRLALGKDPIIFYGVIAGYTIFELVNLTFWESLFTTFNGNGAVVGNFIVLLLSLYYMLQLSKSEEILHFQKSPTFWLVSALLLSCALTSLALMAYKYYIMFNLYKEGATVLNILDVAYILKFGFFIIALICYNHPPHRSSSQHHSLS